MISPLSRWALVLLLATCNPLSARETESPVHLTLILEQPTARPDAVRLPRLADLMAVRGASVPLPSLGDGPSDHARPSHLSLFPAEKLRWFLLAGSLAAVYDRRLLRQFDPDLLEGERGDDRGPRTVSSLGTGIPMLVAIGTPYVIGGSYGRKSTRLAVAALVDATIVTESLKFLTGKERPFQSGGQILFHGPGSGFNSFPSGHTSASFAVATVLGHRYPRYRTALTLLATGIGVSRMSLARHFPSDVVVGAGVGIFAGRRALATDGRVLGLGWRF